MLYFWKELMNLIQGTHFRAEVSSYLDKPTDRDDDLQFPATSRYITLFLFVNTSNTLSSSSLVNTLNTLIGQWSTETPCSPCVITISAPGRRPSPGSSLSSSPPFCSGSRSGCSSGTSWPRQGAIIFIPTINKTCKRKTLWG